MSALALVKLRIEEAHTRNQTVGLRALAADYPDGDERHRLLVCSAEQWDAMHRRLVEAIDAVEREEATRLRQELEQIGSPRDREASPATVLTFPVRNLPVSVVFTSGDEAA